MQQCCSPLCSVVVLLTSLCPHCRLGGGRVGSEKEPQPRVSQMVRPLWQCFGWDVVLRFVTSSVVCRFCRFALLTVMTSEYESMHQKLKSSHVLKVTALLPLTTHHASVRRDASTRTFFVLFCFFWLHWAQKRHTGAPPQLLFTSMQITPCISPIQKIKFMSSIWTPQKNLPLPSSSLSLCLFVTPKISPSYWHPVHSLLLRCSLWCVRTLQANDIHKYD